MPFSIYATICGVEIRTLESMTTGDRFLGVIYDRILDFCYENVREFRHFQFVLYYELLSVSNVTSVQVSRILTGVYRWTLTYED